VLAVRSAEIIVCDMGRVAAHVIFDTQEYGTPINADSLLVLKLGSISIYARILFQNQCAYFLDDQYQLLFDIYFLFYEFSDQHKGKFHSLVPCNPLAQKFTPYYNLRTD
jgi:hypothetical protein